jgi:hypothetical protein
MPKVKVVILLKALQPLGWYINLGSRISEEAKESKRWGQQGVRQSLEQK